MGTLVRFYEFLHVFGGEEFPPIYMSDATNFHDLVDQSLSYMFGNSTLVREWDGQSAECKALNEEVYKRIQNVGLFNLRQLGDLVTLYEDLKYDSDHQKTNKDYRVMALFTDIVSWIIDRSKHYAKLIDFRDEAEEKGLLAPISSKSTYASRYNEVPGDNGTLAAFYDDDDHASSTDRRVQETESDGATQMERLAEIIRGYPDIVSDYADEFERRFAVYEEI